MLSNNRLLNGLQEDMLPMQIVIFYNLCMPRVLSSNTPGKGRVLRGQRVCDQSRLAVFMCPDFADVMLIAFAEVMHCSWSPGARHVVFRDSALG